MHARNTDIRLIIKIARLYYLEGMTQEEISARFQISRSTVSRLIKQAHDHGLLTITIAEPPEAKFSTLEEEMERRFGLMEAVLVEPGATADETRARLGKAAADYVQRVVRPNQTIAVSWGSTLAKLAQAVEPRPIPGVKVVPLLGGSGRTDLALHANQIAQGVARAMGGEWYPLLAPVLVSSEAHLKAFLTEEPIQEVLEMAARSQVAIVGVAGMHPTATMRQTGYLGSEEVEELLSLGAVGDICSYFIDADGRPCAPFWNNRVVGLSLEKLCRIPLVIGLAAGEEKATAIRASIKGGYIKVLITDTETARAMLER